MIGSKRITIRNVSSDLVQKLKAAAEAGGTSVNATVLRLLEEALGVDERRRRIADRYGTWTEEDFRGFEEALAAQRMIDGDLWR